MWESKILTEAFLTELRYRVPFSDVIQKQTPKNHEGEYSFQYFGERFADQMSEKMLKKILILVSVIL